MTAAGPSHRAGFRAPPVKLTDANSLMNMANPMPTGARNVARCFSLASMMIAKTSMAVQTASMKRPWTVEAPDMRAALTVMGVGYIMSTSQAATHAAPHCTAQRRRPRAIVTSRRMVRAIVT